MVKKRSPYRLTVDPDLLKQIAPGPDVEFDVRVVGDSVVITPLAASGLRFRRASEEVIAKYHSLLKSLAE